MACLAVEELSRVDGSCGVLVDVQNTLVTNALLKWGNEAQKEKYLTKMAKEWVGSYCLSESGSGSDAFALQCRAEKKGDKYVLNGQKLRITNAKEASLFLVFTTVDKNAGYKGITGFIVEKGWNGFTVGKKEDKLGIRASSTCELIFENCEVPLENVLGEVGKGYKIAIETLNEGRIGIGAQMIGVAQGALEAALKYSQSRTPIRQKYFVVSRHSISIGGSGDKVRIRAPHGLSCCSIERFKETVFERSRDGEMAFEYCGRACVFNGHRRFRRKRIHQRISSREILS